MKRFEFQLSIPAHTCMAYYRGAIRQVQAATVTGETVQFPAALLRSFVTETGIHGRFVLTCDDDRKGAKMARLA